jgi:hypothetical protein
LADYLLAQRDDELTFWKAGVLGGEMFVAHQLLGTQRWIADAL